MHKAILVALLVLALAVLLVPAALAHQGGPCNVSDEPGNSDFAQHHIVPFAQAGDLGFGGHVPGTHMGYSTCLGVHD